MKCITILKLTMWKGKRRLIKKYGKIFFKKYYNESLALIKEIIQEVPNIGKSLFRFNYEFGICYVVWFKILKNDGFKNEDIIKEIWELTNDFLHIIPQSIMRFFAKIYLNSWYNGAQKMVEKENKGLNSKLDYKIRFDKIDDKTFEITFLDCAMRNLFQKYNTMELMPGICRIDYLMFNYMNIGFERTKTLGDGDEYCNCRYSFKGTCEWSPEKGFVNRK
jgi:hypothetical protein